MLIEFRFLHMKIDENILTGYLTGSLDNETKKKVEEWYYASKENKEILDRLYFTLRVATNAASTDKIDTVSALNALKKKIRNRNPKK